MKRKNKREELFEEIKKRKDVKRLTYITNGCIIVGCSSFVLDALLSLVGVGAIVSAVLVLLMLGSIWGAVRFGRKKKTLINRLIEIKINDVEYENEQLKTEQASEVEPFDNFSTKEEQVVQSKTNEVSEKTEEDDRWERKEKADKLVSYFKTSKLLFGAFCAVALVFGFMLVFAPIVDIEILQISIYDLFSDETLRNEFLDGGKNNKIVFYSFITALSLLLLLAYMAITFLVTLPNKLTKIRNGIEHPERQVYFYPKSANSTFGYGKVGKVISFIMISILYLAELLALVFLPVAIMIEYKDYINTGIVLIDVVLIVVAVIIAIMQYVHLWKLDKEDARLINQLTEGKVVKRD